MQADNRTEADLGANSPLHEKTLAARNVFSGHVLKVDLLDIELPDGRRAVRELIRHRPAVAVLARKPDGKFDSLLQFAKYLK